MPSFMLNRKIVTPGGYKERNCLLVSYELPMLKHCFVLCCETKHEQGDQERSELMTFFLLEAHRLAQQCVGDPFAFMLVHSGKTVRKRSSWHLHVFVIQYRWQKAWVYTILGIKNLALVCYEPLRKFLGIKG